MLKISMGILAACIIGAIFFFSLEYFKPKEIEEVAISPKYIAVDVIMQRPVTSPCEKVEIKPCGVSLTKCTESEVVFHCLNNVAIIKQP